VIDIIISQRALCGDTLHFCVVVSWLVAVALNRLLVARSCVPRSDDLASAAY
jgi:hypothetical protein